MRVLLVRHAVAEESSASGADGDRTLSEEGMRKFRRAARGLAELAPELGLVATSPLVRARQTAELLAGEHPRRPELVELPALGPGGGAAAVLSFLRARRGVELVALVGHEPDLSRLEGALLTGEELSLAELRKGGAALLELPPRLVAGGARLLWHLTPKQLRALAP